jgi:hypothetical protein
MRDASPADRKRGFQIHALAFVVGMIVMAIINYFASPSYYWVLWVLLGWGIGLLAHWWFVLGPGLGSMPGDKRG